MVSLVRITSADFPDFYEPLLRDWDARLTYHIWQRAFTCLGPDDEDYFGHALVDDGRMVGMVGLRFSQRTIRGHSRRFCNVHSWTVLPDYRAKGFLLLRPALALKDHTLTDLTPTDEVAEMTLRLGYTEMEGGMVALPVLPWKRATAGVTLDEMTAPAAAYAERISPDDLRIYQDHQGIDCGHALVSTPGGYCYLVYSRIEQRFRPHSYVHYVSEPRLLAEHHAAIRAHVMARTRTRFAVADERLLAGVSVPYSFRMRGRKKLFRPAAGVTDRDVDSLYSEIVYLKQPALPSLRPRLLTAMRARRRAV